MLEVDRTAIGPSILNRDVAALHIARLAQSLAERENKVREQLGRLAVKKSDHRYRRLLRARHKRPRCRAELPASDETCHLIPPA